MYQNCTALKQIAKDRGFTERRLAETSGLARGTIRSIFAGHSNVTIDSILTLAEALGCRISVIVTQTDGMVEFGVLASALHIERHGFESWKIHIMNFVDEFRRTRDVRLILLPPPRTTDMRIKALLASTVVQLCEEFGIDPPDWAMKRYFLPKPWFVSGMESLKATALLESPLPFRRNNLFVQNNFLTRA